MSVTTNTARDWKFYTAIVAGIALAGTGIFLISNHNSYFYQKNRLNAENTTVLSRENNKSEPVQVFSPEEYESMTDTIISVMSAEQRLAAANLLKLRGNTAFSNKHYLDAIRFYSQAIRFKADPVFYSNRAACYANLGNQNQKVLQDCNEAILLKPTYTKAINRRAQALERNGDLINALFDYTSVCILEGFKNENAIKSMERLLQKLSEVKAKEMIKTRSPRLPSPTFITSYLDSFHLNIKDVIPSTVDQESGDAYYAKARRSLAEKNYYDALGQCTKAVALSCSTQYQPFALNLKGTLSFLKGDADLALQCFQQSMELDPTLVQNYIKCSSIYMEKGGITNALFVFEKAIALNPLDPDIYYHRGQVYYMNGNFHEALLDYKKCIELDSMFVFSYIQLAVCQFQLNQKQESIITLEAATLRFPLSCDIFNYYGEILAAQKRKTEATQLFDKAMSLDPNNPLPYINKAMVMYQNGDVEQAIQLCKSALEADPACDAAVASLAQMLVEQDRHTEALSYYEKAVDLARTETELQLAVSYVIATQMQIRFAHQYGLRKKAQ